MPQPPGAAFRQFLAEAAAGWAGTSFMAALRTSTRDKLVAAGEVVRFVAGDHLVVEGDRDDVVYLLLRSYVKVTAQLPGGGVALLAVRVGGDAVGELAAVDGSPRSATVSACGREPVVAVRLEAVKFQAVLAEDGAASLRLSASISEKLRAATRRRVDYTGLPPKQRLARALVELAATCGRSTGAGGLLIHAGLTQIELGTLIGVSRATAERALGDLRQRGLVDTSGRHALIRDFAALRAFAS